MINPSQLRALFVWIARLEGSSLLLLMGVCMPLKYLGGWPLGVEVVGMAHGVLFLLYVAALAVVTFALRWPLMFSAGALLASVLPFGTFVVERRMPALAPDSQ